MAKKKKRHRPPPAKTQVLSVRVPLGLLPKLDSYVDSLREESPGGNWSRSSAALNLISSALKGWQVEK